MGSCTPEMRGCNMVRLEDIKGFLKTFDLFSGYGIGRIDVSKTSQLGVYNLKSNARHKCIGDTQKCDIKPVSLLIHGYKSKSQTEALANSLYKTLDQCKDATIGGRKVYMIELLWDEPIDVDASDNKIYEYVIEVNFYVEREV